MTRNGLFDRDCPTCGHRGMTKTQAPSPGEPTEIYRCPECGSTDTDDDAPGGMFVSKL